MLRVWPCGCVCFVRGRVFFEWRGTLGGVCWIRFGIGFADGLFSFVVLVFKFLFRVGNEVGFEGERIVDEIGFIFLKNEFF